MTPKRDGFTRAEIAYAIRAAAAATEENKSAREKSKAVAEEKGSGRKTS